MTGNKYEKHKYYEEHKGEIIADLCTIGRLATRKKWDIATSSLVQLEKRWLSQEERKTIKTYGPYLQEDINTPAVAGDPTSFPAFPAFLNTWAPEVQAAWLEAYAKLKGSDDQN